MTPKMKPRTKYQAVNEALYQAALNGRIYNGVRLSQELGKLTEKLITDLNKHDDPNSR